jgi:2-polyprenyl-6-methoxyphenol hydroxylase-like FAD-dependent oxidoreductase
MKVLISGAGIAGLTLAHWLRRSGHDVVLVEKSPSLRGEGYMIDFFGSGYDVAEKMGLLPDLETIHYPIPRMAFVDAKGREKFCVSYAAIRRLFDGRHFNFMRGDLERVLYATLKDGVLVRFGTTVEAFRQEEEGSHVSVTFSDGATDRFDLLVGADGVHSQLRKQAFGEEERFTRFLGYHTAAFILADRPPELRSDSLYTLTVPGRQVSVYPIRDDKLATFFIHKAQRQIRDFSFETAVGELLAVYGGLGWVVPKLLERCDRVSMYFDEVSQIDLSRWSVNRVVLVGDACQCVSLLAGQGASLAMGGAYVLAQELARMGKDLAGAIRAYEDRVKPAIKKKQKAGRLLAGWFVPETPARLAFNDHLTRMAEWPLAWRGLRHLLAPESIIGS